MDRQDIEPVRCAQGERGSQNKMTIADPPASLRPAGQTRRHQQIRPFANSRRQFTARQLDKTTGGNVATRFKVMRAAPVRFAHLSEVDPSVTDSAPPESAILVCSGGGIRLEIASETGDAEFSLKALV
ncbi:MAG: hypothetical protein U1F47_05100 [Hyphomicrobiales bacterium]